MNQTDFIEEVGALCNRIKRSETRLGVNATILTELGRFVYENEAQLQETSEALNTSQPFDTAPSFRPIEAYHKHWKCWITIQENMALGGIQTPWVERTATTGWPREAFSHWRECSAAPESTPTPERKTA